MFPATLSVNSDHTRATCLGRTPMNSKLTDRAHFVAAVLLLVSAVPAAAEPGKYLYIQTNDVREGQNAVLGYHRHDDGALTPLPGNPFYTAGTGIDNDTHGKLGPNDNDTPLIISPGCKRLFAVNT